MDQRVPDATGDTQHAGGRVSGKAAERAVILPDYQCADDPARHTVIMGRIFQLDCGEIIFSNLLKATVLAKPYAVTL